MSPTIYLVRHGETEWNRDDRMQGQRDAPLTARGREQVRAIGRMLTSLGIANLPTWVSPLGRTRTTVSLLAETMTLGPISLDPRLQEIALGSWEGLTGREIAAAHPDIVDNAERAVWGFLSPDGEGFDAGAQRVGDWLRERHEPAVIAVAHGMVGRVLRSLYTGMPRDKAMAAQLPQDVVWCFHDGVMTELSVDGAAYRPGAVPHDGKGS